MPVFQVRMSLWGHIHMYERTHPIGGTVYMTIGVGGARLDTQVKEPQPEWSAYRHAEFGACFFTFDHLNNEIHMQYCAADTNEVLDQFSFTTTPHPESALPRNHSADVFPILPLTEPPPSEDAPPSPKKEKKDKPKDKPKEKKEPKPIPPKLNAAGEHITSDLKSPNSNKANEPHASNTGNPANAPTSSSANPPSVAPIPVAQPSLLLATTVSTTYEEPRDVLVPEEPPKSDEKKEKSSKADDDDDDDVPEPEYIPFMPSGPSAAVAASPPASSDSPEKPSESTPNASSTPKKTLTKPISPHNVLSTSSSTETTESEFSTSEILPTSESSVTISHKKSPSLSVENDLKRLDIPPPTESDSNFEIKSPPPTSARSHPDSSPNN